MPIVIISVINKVAMQQNSKFFLCLYRYKYLHKIPYYVVLQLLVQNIYDLIDICKNNFDNYGSWYLLNISYSSIRWSSIIRFSVKIHYSHTPNM